MSQEPRIFRCVLLEQVDDGKLLLKRHFSTRLLSNSPVEVLSNTVIGKAEELDLFDTSREISVLTHKACKLYLHSYSTYPWLAS